jgi:RNase H-fold protein (predicted Holliday junction resolvase)
MVTVGLDYGRKKTGVAVLLQGLVLPREAVFGSWNRILGRLEELSRLYNGIDVVLGLPLSALGKPTELSMEVEQFAGKLRESGYTVHLVNEVGSSAAAVRLAGRKDRNGRVDSLAACEILKRFLNIYD